MHFFLFEKDASVNDSFDIFIASTLPLSIYKMYDVRTTCMNSKYWQVEEFSNNSFVVEIKIDFVFSETKITGKHLQKKKKDLCGKIDKPNVQ